jgi:putative SOS response-associated peptidase YedK
MLKKIAIEIAALSAFCDTHSLDVALKQTNHTAQYGCGIPVITKDTSHYMHWGFQARESASNTRPITNYIIKCEALLEGKPHYRKAFHQHNRCLTPVSGYYETIKVSGQDVTYYVEHAEGDSLLIAGLWNSVGMGANGRLTAGLITKESFGEVESCIHRIPVVVPPEHAREWLCSSSITYMDTLTTQSTIALTARRV